MAGKKNAAPETEVPVNEEVLEPQAEEQTGPDPQMLKMQAEIERLKKENERLKQNSVYSASPMGSASDYERVQAACEKAAADGVDPWTVKISVLAARIGKGEDSYWLCVNGKTMQVPANERYYELALPLAQCLVDEIQARRKAADFADSIQVYDPKENPHPVEK